MRKFLISAFLLVSFGVSAQDILENRHVLGTKINENSNTVEQLDLSELGISKYS